MILRELLARMGIVVDEGSIKKADHAIEKFAENAKRALEVYGVFKLYEFVKSKFEGIAETAAGLEHLAQKTGMTTEALQELSYAAQQSGVDAHELQMGLVHLSRSAFEAATQGGAAGAAFYRLGVAVSGADGHLKPTNTLLAEVADKFAALPDGPEKAALSLHLFSRAGAELIPLLNGGSAGLAKWGAAARATGGIMSESMVKQGVELHHGLIRLHMTLEGLTYAVLGPFVKAMTSGKNSLFQWIVAHERLISLRVQNVVLAIAGAFSFAAELALRFATAAKILGAALFVALFPVTALLTTLLLLLDDVNSFFQGRKSVMGDLVDFFGGPGPGGPKKGQGVAPGGQGTGVPTAGQGFSNFMSHLFGAPPGPTPAGGTMNFNPNITINAPSGDAKDIAGAVREQIEDYWWTQLRQNMPF